MHYRLKIIALAVIILSSCSKKDTTADPDQPDEGGNTPVLKSIQLAKDPLLGTIMKDSLGKTLYIFAFDADGTSNCTEGCAVSWPVFYREHLTINYQLTDTDFGVITRKDGRKQTTYKGWPLYYYNGDTKPGDINGNGSVGTWFVAKPDYTVMLANDQLTGEDGVQYNAQLQPGQEILQYLTDDYGRTLYTSANDGDKANNYTDKDFMSEATWQFFSVDTLQSVPSVLDKNAFVKITIFGKSQLTYKGWPLYHYINDKKTRGNTKGVSIKTPAAWSYINMNSAAAPVLP